jgi:hypothetical protein
MLRSRLLASLNKDVVAPTYKEVFEQVAGDSTSCSNKPIWCRTNSIAGEMVWQSLESATRRTHRCPLGQSLHPAHDFIDIVTAGREAGILRAFIIGPLIAELSLLGPNQKTQTAVAVTRAQLTLPRQLGRTSLLAVSKLSNGNH